MKQDSNLDSSQNKSRKYSLLKNKQGQAVVEYVLLLIVIVSLLLAFRGIFTSMNTFMSDYMGEYVVCLMEYGELPTMGVSEEALKKHTTATNGRKCEFRSFTASSKDTKSSSASGNTSSKSGTATNGSKSASSKADNNASDKDSSANSSNSSASSGGRNNRSSSPYSKGAIRRAGDSGVADGAGSSQDKVKEIEEESSGRGGRRSAFSGTRQRRIIYDRSGYKAITGSAADQFEKSLKKPVRVPGTRVVASSEDGYRFRPHKKTFSPPVVKEQAIEEKQDDMSFGSFFKWLVIAGILIACFILFGGQILSYSNSDS